MGIKYALYPGFVRSKNDGDEHYISAPALARLYRVPMSECVTVDRARPETFLGREALIARLVALYPRHDGRYVASP